MEAAISSGRPYQTRLTPVPADPSYAIRAWSLRLCRLTEFGSDRSRLAGDVGAILAAVLKAMVGAKPFHDVRLAAAFVMEPRLLVPLLSAAKAAEWHRLVGAEADPLAGNVDDIRRAEQHRVGCRTAKPPWQWATGGGSRSWDMGARPRPGHHRHLWMA